MTLRYFVSHRINDLSLNSFELRWPNRPTVVIYTTSVKRFCISNESVHLIVNIWMMMVEVR